MNKNTRRRLMALRKSDPTFFKHKARVRSGHKGKVSCLTYKNNNRLKELMTPEEV